MISEVFIEKGSPDKSDIDLIEAFENESTSLTLPNLYFCHQFGNETEVYNSIIAKLNYAAIQMLSLKEDDPRKSKYAELIKSVVFKKLKKHVYFWNDEDCYVNKPISKYGNIKDKNNPEYIFSSYESLYNFIFMTESCICQG